MDVFFNILFGIIGTLTIGIAVFWGAEVVGNEDRYAPIGIFGCLALFIFGGLLITIDEFVFSWRIAFLLIPLAISIICYSIWKSE